MTRTKIIIDTDPGCDDILALLFALAADPEQVEVALISVTFGNIGVKGCLQNVVSMFHVIQKEMEWRESIGKVEGFEMLRKSKPLVAVGAKAPLGGQTMMADYYHGIDGLGGVQTSHPHHTSPSETWLHLFEPPPPQSPSNDLLTETATATTHTTPTTHSHLFTASPNPSPDEILRILSSNPPDTVVLIAIGPLTTFALAAASDPITFLRAKSLLVMGGTITEPGNITPVAEFNTIADPIAAARIYALTSPDPRSTMPPPQPSNPSPEPEQQQQEEAEDALPSYPSAEKLGPSRLNLITFPLDITTSHLLSSSEVLGMLNPLINIGSPLAEWISAFLTATFQKTTSLYTAGEAELSLHDLVPVWYALDEANPPDLRTQGWEFRRGEDIRVETTGQWTRGMCVVDRRGMRMLEEGKDRVLVVGEGDVSGDHGGWLSRWRGNRVGRCVGTPDKEYDGLGGLMLWSIFRYRDK